MKSIGLKKVLSAIPIILITSYCSGLVSQFMYNYHVWQLSGNQMGSTVHPNFPSTSFTKCIEALFIIPYGLYGLFICVGIILVLVVYFTKVGRGGSYEYDRERNIKFSNEGSLGTSSYMSEKRAEESIKGCTRCFKCKWNNTRSNKRESVICTTR